MLLITVFLKFSAIFYSVSCFHVGVFSKLFSWHDRLRLHSIHLAFGLRKGKAAEEPAPAPAKNGKGKGKAEEPKETGATTSAAILDIHSPRSRFLFFAAQSIFYSARQHRSLLSPRCNVFIAIFGLRYRWMSFVRTNVKKTYSHVLMPA